MAYVSREIATAKGREYYVKNQEALRAKKLAYYNKNLKDNLEHREKVKLYHKQHYIKNRDRILKNQKEKGWPQRVERLEKVAGRARPATCEVCGSGVRKICFDHNHKTGNFRGWICDDCNTILGLARDSKENLKKLIGYLEADDKKPIADKEFFTVDDILKISAPKKKPGCPIRVAQVPLPR